MATSVWGSGHEHPTGRDVFPPRRNRKARLMGKSAKVVLVVGGARGIGRVTVDLLIARGDRVWVVDVDEQGLDACREEHGDAVRTRRMDLTDRDDVKQALAWVKAEADSLDAVVMTAAVHSAFPVEYLTDDAIDRVLDINLTSQIRFVRDVLPLVGDGGRLVTVSSVSASVGIPMESVYSASKAGLELFFESLSFEVAHRNIRCVIVRPGNVNTGFNETGNDYEPVGNKAIDDVYRNVLSRIDSRYGIPPEQVAKAIVRSLERPNPPLCVLVGANAIKAHWALRLLGRDLALKVMKRVMRL